jgi:hypothetical protein
MVPANKSINEVLLTNESNERSASEDVYRSESPKAENLEKTYTPKKIYITLMKKYVLNSLLN